VSGKAVQPASFEAANYASHEATSSCGGGCVDADHAGDLHDFEDFFDRGTVAQGIFHVQLSSALIEVGGGDIEGDVDEFLDLGLQRAVLPRRR
jgi:hypothetical protein